jgi:hypothetical protein
MAKSAPAKTNEDIERHYFDQFCQVYALPEGAVTHGDKPDVVIAGRTTTGIEITNLYLQSGTEIGSEQRQRPFRASVVAGAQRLYRLGGGRGIELTVAFDGSNPISPARRRVLPALLAAFAHRIDKLQSGPIDNAAFRETMPELESVYLNAKDYADAQWRIAQLYSVEMASMENLISVVAQKEVKATNYRRCDRLWLLVVVDWIDQAQEQEIRTDNLEIESSVFEKIILFKPNFNHVVELAVRRRLVG